MPVMTALDADGNGFIEPSELSNAGAALMNLDKNGDGRLSVDELQPRRPEEGGHQH